MIDILQKAARNAGEVLMKYFNQGVTASYKSSHKNLVTVADLASQKIIYETIVTKMVQKGFKKDEIGFIGEENLNINGKYKFIIDPLDGTNNFASGYGYFCVSIAYAINNKTVAGVIYNPSSNILYTTELGKGSYKVSFHQKKLLKVQKKKLKDSLLVAIFNTKEIIFHDEFKIYEKIYPVIRGLRTNQSTALDMCNLADNIFQIHVNGNSYIWDIAAAKLIVEESNASVTDWQGKEIKLDFNNPKKSYRFIACHSKLLHEVLKFFD
ncbi:hypothetical protein A3C98_03115 [Candidatus Roizmanbacteria bacterium RIFCSPHIGHO2_02_FULL_37_15]|nr:MAG: hypothetical protein A3C98_03115 [Candidatus Roizmanbacteria bacterium RIFCSPHIGHO2_02_FULL_37_15]